MQAFRQQQGYKVESEGSPNRQQQGYKVESEGSPNRQQQGYKVESEGSPNRQPNTNLTHDPNLTQGDSRM